MTKNNKNILSLFLAIAVTLLTNSAFAECDGFYIAGRAGFAKYEIEDKKLREYIRNINECFKKRKISKPKVNNIARTLKYFIKYFKAGMKYGIINYEEKILQTLINEYVDESNIISETATLWHKVLY